MAQSTPAAPVVHPEILDRAQRDWILNRLYANVPALAEKARYTLTVETTFYRLDGRSVARALRDAIAEEHASAAKETP